ncbi:MAG: BRO family protein [Lutibacter sp.]
MPKRYWSELKKKLAKEGSQLYEDIVQLKFVSADGKKYATDCLNTAQLFRLIQSIPSPKAESFKIWLAQVGSERLNEMQDPELSIDRALENYLQLGYSENWINQRLKSIEIRKELTNEWKSKGLIEGAQFAILTDIITKAWSEKTTKEYNPDIYRDERVEKRKSSGQYDEYRINFEYVSRSFYQRYFASD